MALFTASHFGGNTILTNDSAVEGTPYREMLKEIDFTSFRYPGGAVTEQQTWANGGLARVFGEPMQIGDPNYVMTLREALVLCMEEGSSMTIVIPTFQFHDTNTGTFDQAGFDRYTDELGEALSEFPRAKIDAFEIGNEYWADGRTAVNYGKVANFIIPELAELREDLAASLGESWQEPSIGLQAGAQFRKSGLRESSDIADQIDVGNRALVETIFQHAYPGQTNPNVYKETAIGAMKVYTNMPGFPSDLKFSLSEFNTWNASSVGVNQAGNWIEELHGYIDGGIDQVLHWGTQYKYLTTKFYDSKLPPDEARDSEISAIATPVGQLFDLAQSQLVGTRTLSDSEAIRGMSVSDGVGVTGFGNAEKTVVFFHNDTGTNGTIDFSAIPVGHHLSIHHQVPADSPYTPGRDESVSDPPILNGVSDRTALMDVRGDMKVSAGQATPSRIAMGDNELVTAVITAPGKGVVLEGAHNVTDHRSGMVDDHMVGTGAGDILRGHVGNDTLSGGEGRDVISGGRGDDHLSGDGGDDILIADRGKDVVDGGDGDDVFLVTGTRDGDHVTITTGKGKDLILTGGNQSGVVTDFAKGDMIGFNAVFAHEDELSAATRIDDEDMIVTLPSGKEITFTGGAEIAGDLSSMVIDFAVEDPATVQQINDTIFDGLSHAQLEEFYQPSAAGALEGQSLQASNGRGGLASSDRLWGERPEIAEAYGIEKPEFAYHDVPGDAEYNPVEGEWPGTPPVYPDEPDEPPYPDEPDEPPHPDEPAPDRPLSEGGGGGGCFVATAAYGDFNHPDVVALRAFRDIHLVRSTAGRAFIAFYWVVGPQLARVTLPHYPHAAAARVVLSRFVRLLRRADLVRSGSER